MSEINGAISAYDISFRSIPAKNGPGFLCDSKVRHMDGLFGIFV